MKNYEELEGRDILNNQLKYLNDMLTEKTSEVENLNKEKNSLNEQILQIQEESILKDNEITSLKSNLLKKEEEVNNLIKEKEELEKKNKELNNKIISNENLKEMFENHNLSKKEISQNEFLKIQYELNLKLSEIQCKLDE